MTPEEANAAKEALKKIGGKAYEKLKVYLSEVQFRNELLSVCRSITEYLDKNSSLTEDVRNLLSDRELKKLIEDTLNKKGFDFETELNKGFNKLFKQYEIPNDVKNTCFRMLWQSIIAYLKTNHSDFYLSILVDETHTSVKNIENITEKGNRTIEENNNILKDIYNYVVKNDEENKVQNESDSINTSIPNQERETTKNSIRFTINPENSFCCSPEDKIRLVDWIAKGCDPDVEIIFHDERIICLEEKCLALQKEIESGTDSNDSSNNLILFRQQQETFKLHDSELARAFKLFLKLNKQWHYLFIDRIEDIVLIIQAIYQIACDHKPFLNEDYKPVAFNIRKSANNRNFSFSVYIGLSALYKLGLDDSKQFSDVCIYSYFSFDVDTQRNIVASFINKLITIEDLCTEEVWKDPDVQDLSNYDLKID